VRAAVRRLESGVNQKRLRRTINDVIDPKIARIAWAMMVRGERFKEPRLLPIAA
jgi:hypothetical protein